MGFLFIEKRKIMAWYNPLSRFKNSPLRRAVQTTPTLTGEEATPTNEEVEVQWDIVSTPITTDSLSFQPSGSLLYDSIRAFRQWAKERAWESFANIADQNRQNAFEIEGFSSDPYNTSNSLSWDNPINGTVTTEGADMTKTRWDAIQDAFEVTWVRRTGNIFKDILWWWTVLANAAEQKYPIVGARNVERAAKSAYWGELEYKSPTWLTYKYRWATPMDFSYDIQRYLAAEEAYNQWVYGRNALESLWDDLYEKYKNDIYTRWHGRYYQEGITRDDIQALNRERWLWTISRETFIDFIENEKNKETFRSDEYERRNIDIDSDESRSRVAEWTQYVTNVVAPLVQNSSLWTVETRKEFMNDVVASAQSLIWRWDSAMTQTYRTKAWLQRLYNTDDIYTIDKNTMAPEHIDILNSIEVNERNYNQFVKNLAKYISLLPSYADPNTWKIEKIPDAVVDPDTWKAMTFQEMLFDWVTVIWWIWWNTYLWEDSTSPVDMLRKSSAQIARAKSDLTEWRWWRIWANAQYRLWTNLWWTVNETSQKLLWGPLTFARNVFSKKSWEIPFEFIDMDTSILSTLTTNRSRAWRLLQNYAQKTLEYVPEIWWNIIEAVLLDKWLSKWWTVAQLWTQTRLNRIPWMRNSLAWRQINLWLSYTAKILQRLWTDQAIDAALSIWDDEPMSDISKKLSVWGTLLGEWLWILSDLKVLWRSFSNYFKPEWFKYGGLTDPIKLMADNPWILDDYAAALWRGVADESWKIVWDEYKLLLQDLWEYSKFLKKLSWEAENIVKEAIREWISLDTINKTFKDWVYDVVKQAFAQNSAMAKTLTALLTDSRANIADMVKYIWNIEWVVKVGPFISTIKVSDSTKTFMERVVKNYDQKMDLIVDWWLVSWVNRWLTRQEVETLFDQWFLKASAAGDSVSSAIDDYFIPIMEWGEVRYFPTERWLKALNVETSVVNAPLAIVSMTEDTQELINKLKTLSPSQKRLSDTTIDAIWETNAIDRLAENIAWIDYLDICK